MSIPPKTLVLRLSSIGDIVLSSALLRTLRTAAGREARIDYVVRKEYADLVRYNHHLSVVHVYDPASGFDGLKTLAGELRREGYGLVVDIHDSIRTKLLRTACRAERTVVIDKRKMERWLLVNLKRNAYDGIVSVAERYIETVAPFGVAYDGKGLEIFIPDAVQFDVSGRMAKLRLDRFETVIGLCPGSRHFTKRWQTEKFAEVGLRAAKELKAKVLLFGGPGENGDCSVVERTIAAGAGADTVTNFAGSFSLLESAAALEFCDAVVTNDSGLMHLAAAKQKKTVAVFGSTVREFGFAPFGTEAVVVEEEGMECRPCTHIGRRDCPKGHFHCMNGITADRVFTAVTSLLAHR